MHRPRARIRAAMKNTGFLRRLGAATVSTASRLAVRSAPAFNAAAVLSLRCATGAGVALHNILDWSAAIIAAAFRRITRISLKLGKLAAALPHRAAGAVTALSGMIFRLAAAIMAAAIRFAGALRGLAAWLRGGIASLGTVRPRIVAIGLGAAVVVFVAILVPWIQRSDLPFQDFPGLATGPAGGDFEDEIATAPMKLRGPFIEPAPFPPAADSPGELSVALSEVPAPPRDPASNRLALLPERPRARPRRERPQWLVNAVEPDLRDAGPLIAIVIDDVGIAQKRTARTIDLPAPLTLAFIPYGDNLGRHTRRARGRGHELIVHIPMEPGSRGADPGPNALLTGLDDTEIMRRFLWGLSQFDGYVGVSNHMGSRFMARADLLEPLLAVTRERGLLFLDSRTTADTAGTGIARRLQIPNAQRDVFLDNEITVKNVTAQLAEVERIARRQGHAVAIGHPHDVTVDTLAAWIPAARARGFTLVPVSTIVRLEYGGEYEKELAAAIPAGGEAESLLGRP